MFALFKIPLFHQMLSLIYSKGIPLSEVYVIEGMGCILPVVFRKDRKSKIILINDDSFFDTFDKIGGLRKYLYNKLIKNIDGVISTSKLVDSKIPVKAIPREIVPLFLNVNRFKNISPDFKKKTIGYIGRLITPKGSDILFKVFLKIHDYDQEYKLDVIGPLWDRRTVKEFNSIKKRYPESIHTTEFTNHPWTYIKDCSDYINAARIEPFGINILEAMCAGIPPVVTNRCGAAEFVAKASERLVVEPDVDDLYEAFLWLNEDQKRKRLLAKKCKEIASQITRKKSVDKFKESFFSILDDINRK